MVVFPRLRNGVASFIMIDPSVFSKSRMHYTLGCIHCLDV
jgi:hypothetical protein